MSYRRYAKNLQAAETGRKRYIDGVLIDEEEVAPGPIDSDKLSELGEHLLEVLREDDQELSQWRMSHLMIPIVKDMPERPIDPSWSPHPELNATQQELDKLLLSGPYVMLRSSPNKSEVFDPHDLLKKAYYFRSFIIVTKDDRVTDTKNRFVLSKELGFALIERIHHVPPDEQEEPNEI